VSGVDGFVVFKGVVTDFLQLVSIKVGAYMLGRANKPVLGIPVFRGTINLRSFWDWAVYFCIPLAQAKLESMVENVCSNNIGTLVRIRSRI